MSYVLSLKGFYSYLHTDKTVIIQVNQSWLQPNTLFKSKTLYSQALKWGILGLDVYSILGLLQRHYKANDQLCVDIKGVILRIQACHKT